MNKLNRKITKRDSYVYICSRAIREINLYKFFVQLNMHNDGLFYENFIRLNFTVKDLIFFEQNGVNLIRYYEGLLANSIIKNNISVVKYLLSYPINLHYIQRGLELCASLNRIRILRIFLNYGIPLNNTKHNSVALVKAVQRNRYKIAELLLEHGANVFTYGGVHYYTNNSKMLLLIEKYKDKVSTLEKGEAT
jgi:hypothetical protein